MKPILYNDNDNDNDCFIVLIRTRIFLCDAQ